LQAEKRCERLCGDFLAVHLRKYTLGKIETLSH
jgi:ribosomal protein S27AE